MSVQMGLMMGFLHDSIRITVRATLFFFFLNEQCWCGVLVVVRLLVSVDYVRKGRLVSGYSKTRIGSRQLCFLPPFTPPIEVFTHLSQHERTLCTNISRSEDFQPREECFYPLELGFFPTLASFLVPGLRLPTASPRIAIHSCWHCPSCLPDPSPSCCHCTSDI